MSFVLLMFALLCLATVSSLLVSERRVRRALEADLETLRELLLNDPAEDTAILNFLDQNHKTRGLRYEHDGVAYDAPSGPGCARKVFRAALEDARLKAQSGVRRLPPSR